MQNLSHLFYEFDSAEISFKRIMIRDILEVASAPSPSYARNSQEYICAEQQGDISVYNDANRQKGFRAQIL
jgi:hypothetical protein